jgi:hypothetical protein
MDRRVGGRSFHCLSFNRRDIAEGFHQSMMIEPRHPFQRCELNGLECFPRRTTMNHFCLVQAVVRLSQRVDVPMSSEGFGFS